jgi:hypothetical protein
MSKSQLRALTHDERAQYLTPAGFSGGLAVVSGLSGMEAKRSAVEVIKIVLAVIAYAIFVACLVTAWCGLKRE